MPESAAMSLLSVLTFYTPTLAFHRSASRVLARELPPEQVAQLWQATQQRRVELRKTRPRYSLGLGLVMRYFEWDCALFLAAKENGLDEETAGRLVEEINWQIFGPPTELLFSLSRLRSGRLRKRVEWIVDLMFGVLFTAPFERSKVASEHTVAFDVTVCPLAEYFRDHGAPELTRYAACSLDYRMAEVWGARLDRGQTIARGDAHCDFRFRILKPSDLAPRATAGKEQER